MEQVARDAVAGSSSAVAEEPGKVVPLFRGGEQPAQPLLSLSSGRWKKQDVMREFGVSGRTVERWQLREGLPHEKPFGVKGPVRYDPRKVLAWWQARCANGSLMLGAGVVLHVLGQVMS